VKTATVTEAKNGLSALLDQVKAGESIIITDRGRPIARVVPMVQLEDPDGRLERLERAGVLRRGTGALSADFFTAPIPQPVGSVEASRYILEERESGW
jgi:prevent-host-death family protein